MKFFQILLSPNQQQMLSRVEMDRLNDAAILNYETDKQGWYSIKVNEPTLASLSSSVPRLDRNGRERYVVRQISEES